MKTDKNKDEHLLLMGIKESDLETFSKILYLREQAEKLQNRKITLDQAIAMYALSQVMGGIFFFEVKSED